MATVFRLPKLYENMDEATVGEWFVAENGDVTAGQPLVELITDKTVIEYESPYTGRVLVHYAPSKSVVPIGFALAAIGEPGDTPPDVAAENARLIASAHETAWSPPAAISESPSTVPKLRVAPAARALAKTHDVDLTAVAASVSNRVVHRADVEAFIAKRDVTNAVDSGTPDSASATSRVVLITGASGELGTAIATRFARDGVQLALHYHRNRAAADDLKRTLVEGGAVVQLYGADLRDSGAASQMVDSVMERFGRIDVLVNNAGILDDALLSFMSDEQWQNVVDTNLSSVFFVTRPVALAMARQRRGKIVMIASDAGRLGGAGRANYSAAKSGLAGFTRAAARELAGSGIQVNTISPGFIDSAMTSGLSDHQKRQRLREIPSRRLGRADEVAEVVAFFASSGADYITGQEISVDGGLFMG